MMNNHKNLSAPHRPNIVSTLHITYIQTRTRASKSTEIFSMDICIKHITYISLMYL